MYDWTKEKLSYAFPPFSIIHKVIQKIVQQEVDVILVVPFWPTQPWFALFNKLVCQQPLIIEVNDYELFLPFRTKQGGGSNRHPLAGKLKLLAARCKGNLLRTMGSTKE